MDENGCTAEVWEKKMKRPMIKTEVILFLDLIESNAIINTKETNALTNRLKEEAWNSLTDEFNSQINTAPRTTQQLKLKWDNMKKAARKRVASIKIDPMKPSGICDIPPDEILDRVASLLGFTLSGLEPYGGVIDDPLGEEEMEDDPNTSREKNSEDEIPTPSKKKMKKLCRANKHIGDGRRERNLAIAQYYKKKTEKLDLEIQKLRAELRFRQS